MQAVASCKKLRTPRPKKCFVDRLSPLPNDVLHRVLSYLDFLDVVRTSVLSKRWRFVWTSVPYLNFNMDWFLKYNYNERFECLEPQIKFWDFIKWSLLLRDGSQIIKICMYSDNMMIDQLNGLIRVAARQKVQELCLIGGDYTSKELEFPRGLCETLTVLTLNLCDTIPLRVTTVFSSLQSLTLRGVHIPCDTAEKLLSNGCAKLENIYLEDCQIKDLEQIDIVACNLKNLTIVNVCTCDRFWAVGSFDSKLRVCAPKLLSFCYIGPVLRGFALENTISLKNVSIRLLRVPGNYQVEYKNHLLCPARFVGLNSAKSLTLSTLVVKVEDRKFGLSRDKKLPCEAVPLFIRLKEIPWSRRKSRKGFTSHTGAEELHIILAALSVLKLLSLENRSPWKSRIEDIACLSYNVKFIQVSNLDGSEFVLELVKFLLQNGKVLQKMEIMHRGGERKQKNFKELITLPKASSEVVISFPEYSQRKIPWFDRGDSDPEYDD
ncbi:hypothetical protein DH2020_002515 [Rehmannia glutinosa]|uniref:F-box domain-containing protein n=1 Tax=Rehmannia glutinosa TaxID=99300 RepID=A0ABR0XUL6_REHGL